MSVMFGQEVWRAKLPSSWKVVPLRHFLTSLGQGWSPVAEDREADEDEWAVLKLSAISRGKFKEEQHKALQAADVPNPGLEVKPGDVLVTRANTPQMVGEACFVGDTRPRLIVSDLIYRLRFSGEMDGRFAVYWLISPAGRSPIEVDARGSSKSMVKISQAHIRSWPIVVPPLETQEMVVSFLDRKTAEIDRLIEHKQRLIELLEEKRAAVITRAVTKGLDPDAEMKDSGVEWLGEIPENWEVRPNRSLFIERDERNFPDYPVLTVSIDSGVKQREFSAVKIEQQSEDRSIYKLARKGDVVFNKMRMWQGAVGVAPVDGLVSPDYTVAKPMPQVVPEYFEAVFRTNCFKEEVNRHSYGMVRDRNRLYWLGFKQIMSPCPPRAEQEALVRKLESTNKSVGCLRAKVKKAITLLREYRTALISAAVTGKIDIQT